MIDTIYVILRMYKIELRMQICLRNPRIVCTADHVLQYTAGRIELKFKKEKNDREIKNSFLPFAILILTKAY